MDRNDMNEFARRVRMEAEREFGETWQVRLKEVRKNNGVLLHGLMVIPPGKNVAPTIYLETFYAAYCDGIPFGEVFGRIMEIFREETPGEDIDVNFFRVFEEVRERICFRLVGREHNRELLEDIPYVDFLDLAICFYYAYNGSSLGDGIILIHNSHMEQWGVTIRELMRLAEENTPRLFPAGCSHLQELLDEMGEAGEASEHAGPLMVLTNSRRFHGAACILYPGLLRQIGEQRQDSFYLIPSSIHEVLILDRSAGQKPEEIREMIREVNTRHVAAEEVLSDNLYYYDFNSKTIQIV